MNYRQALHAAGSDLERTFAFHLRAHRITGWVQEYPFATECLRNWRLDFAWVDLRMAVEIEGGTKGFGRHNQPAGFEEDCLKYNEGTIRGWRIIRLTSDMVTDGRGIDVVKRAVKMLSEGR